MSVAVGPAEMGQCNVIGCKRKAEAYVEWDYARLRLRMRFEMCKYHVAAKPGVAVRNV